MAVKTYKASDTTQLTEHFTVQEFRCKCGKTHDTMIAEELVSKLEELYAKLDCSKIVISSGYRCPDHDKSPAVGGSGTGQHTIGRAADFCCYGQDGNPIVSYLVCCAAQDIDFRGIARINDNYTHCDVRENGKWYGDETKGNGSVTTDFYDYYQINKEVKPLKSGIDVSAHQGKIDWSKVKADYAILRAGYGKVISQKDEYFEANYAGAKAAGIPIGAYWYSYAMTPEDAEKEADVFIQVLKGKKFEYPVYFDIEEKQLALGRTKVSAIIRAFLEKVEKAGYWVGLYMSASPLTNLVEDSIRVRYAVWVAHVGVSKPSYSGQYGMWQHSWKGKISGISGDVDLDYAYVDYPEQIKAKGLNGFGDTTPEEPVEEEIPFEMVFGGQKYAGTLKKV